MMMLAQIQSPGTWKNVFSQPSVQIGGIIQQIETVSEQKGRRARLHPVILLHGGTRKERQIILEPMAEVPGLHLKIYASQVQSMIFLVVDVQLKRRLLVVHQLDLFSS